MFQQGLTDTLSATEIRQSIDQTQERTKRSTAGSSAHGFSCSRRLSPLSGRNSTYRPVQISATVSVGTGAVGAFAWWLFRLFSEKWLNSKFEERLAAYKHEQQKELERLKFSINAQM